MLNDRPAKADEGLDGPVFLEGLPESQACAVVMSDGQRKLCGFNPQAESLFKLQAAHVVGQPLEVLPLPLQEIIQETFGTRRAQERQISLSRVDSGELALHASTIIAPLGKHKFGVVAIITDLTLSKNLEEQVLHLGRVASIGTLSASMAHEIKNALVPVRTFLDLLIEKNKDADLTGIVSREIRRIDSIVSQMLRFAGPAKPTFALLHLHDVVEQSLRLVEHQLAGKKIRLKKSLAACPDLIRGDSYQLEQAFLNFVFNALDSMAPKGELFVGTDLLRHSPGAPAGEEGVKLRLRITDTGIGIPPENIARLFDTFFTTKKKGTGLGLSITRRIIKEHSGTISIESEINQGTTFTILFPSAGKL